jgi:hypothetical protein
MGTRIVTVDYITHNGEKFTLTYKTIFYGALLWKEAFKRGAAQTASTDTKTESILSMTVRTFPR